MTYYLAFDFELSHKYMHYSSLYIFSYNGTWEREGVLGHRADYRNVNSVYEIGTYIKFVMYDMD